VGGVAKAQGAGTRRREVTMKDINAVLALKERELLRVKREIQALHLAIVLMMDDPQPAAGSAPAPPTAPPTTQMP
jgi:hypothetical protein